MNAPATAMAQKRFVVLDAMRGFAACVVMTLHYGYLGSTNAYMAVDFFFLLSGFVLAHAYFNRENLSFWSFVQYRFARLYPLHLVTFLATAVLFTAIGLEWFDGEFVLHALMLHNLGLGPPRVAFNAPAWSISVEFWVNVAIGLFVVAALRFKLSRTLRNVVLIAIAAVCYGVLLVWHGHLNAYYHDLMPLVNLGLLRGLASICVGVLLYDVYLYFSARPSDGRHMTLQVLTPLCLIGFAALMIVPIKETPLDFVILAGLMLILVVAGFETGPLAVLARKFDFLGKISFSIYLVHIPIQILLDHLLDDAAGKFGGYVIQFAAVLAVSYLTYTYFEVPSYRWGKRVLRDAGNRLKAIWQRPKSA